MKKFSLLFFFFVIVFSACKKEKFTDAEIKAVSDVVLAQGISMELKNTEEAAKTLNSSNICNACHISVDTTNYNQLTIDFGNAPVVCHDNRFRTGKIIIHYSTNYKATNADLQFSFSNYGEGFAANEIFMLNNNSTKTVTHQSFNTKGFLSWLCSCNINISKPDGSTIVYNESETRLQLSGNSLQLDFNNTFSIKGSCSGNTSDGSTFSASINSGNALLSNFSCAKYFTKGELDITPKNVSTIGVDFGDGSCSNNTANLTRGYSSQNIDLK